MVQVAVNRQESDQGPLLDNPMSFSNDFDLSCILLTEKEIWCTYNKNRHYDSKNDIIMEKFSVNIIRD